MKRIIVITGTPCAGKTTVSEKVAKKLGSCELIRANDLVKGKRLFTGRSRDGELIADMPALRKEIERRVKSSKSETVIIEGHLLCDMKIKGATAIVIREHLDELLRRMKKRGYGKKKTEGNLVSEAIDYCGVNASSNYSEVYEIESGKSAAPAILSVIKGRKPVLKEIDMLSELDGLLKKLGPI